MTYYAQRKVIKDGVPQTPQNYYGEARAMRRQFHLFCANALGGDYFINDVDTIEWGTLEHGVQERVCFLKPVSPEEPTEPEDMT